ncbi:MAG: DUF2332 domain-containing protein [Streptosporangiaceae bacterium]|jgi:hypothetical protein
MSMGGLDPAISLAENYRVWAQEAKGRSPAYVTLSASVADEAAILEFLGTLPPDKRQPNLLFASAYYLLGTPANPRTLRGLVNRDPDALTRVMLTRRTQTNEAARCATLLPALAQLPEPLALIEVGASAGLTLLFDQYSYDYGDRVIAGSDPEAPTLHCGPRGPVPVPARVPEIAWRAGLDLNPLDVNDDDDMHWLSCLLWPGEGDRAQRLAAAIATARRSAPPVHRGDLLTDLPALAAQAPADATLVVYHSAVLAYVAPDDRERFAEIVGDLPAVWFSNEAPGVVASVPVSGRDDGTFVLARNGRQALARTDGHGDFVEWLPAPASLADP